VTRFTADTAPPPMSVHLVLDLLLGPHTHSEEELELAWRAYGDRFSGELGPPGDRRPCWAAEKFGK
jgi:hypothetical protein